jgi:hypothetical protein
MKSSTLDCPATGDNALGFSFKLLNYQITHLPNSPTPLTLFPLSSITSFHLVMGSAVRIRHCPATVCAENLSNMPLGGSHSRLMLA